MCRIAGILGRHRKGICGRSEYTSQALAPEDKNCAEAPGE